MTTAEDTSIIEEFVDNALESEDPRQKLIDNYIFLIMCLMLLRDKDKYSDKLKEYVSIGSEDKMLAIVDLVLDSTY